MVWHWHLLDELEGLSMCHFLSQLNQLWAELGEWEVCFGQLCIQHGEAHTSVTMMHTVDGIDDKM